MNIIGRVELAILFLVVAVMVVKPTAADGWTLTVGAAVLAVSLTVGARSLWRVRRALPEAVATQP